MATGWIVLAVTICVLKSAESSQHTKHCDKGTFDDFPDTSDDNHDICAVSGDPHFRTFDSLRFDFHGNCTYTVCTNRLLDSYFFNIVGEFHRPKKHHDVSVLKRVFIGTSSGALELDRHFNVYDISRNDKVAVTPELANSYADDDAWAIRMYCNAVVITFYNGLKLYWSKPHNLLLQSPGRGSTFGMSNSGNLNGLCGNYNGKKADDLTTRNAEVETDVQKFGHSWRFDNDCKPCEDCISKPLCTTNPQFEDEAKRQCAIFDEASVETNCVRPIYLSDTPKAFADTEALKLECISRLCVELPLFRDSFCELYDVYSNTCTTDQSWQRPPLDECYDWYIKNDIDIDAYRRKPW